MKLTKAVMSLTALAQETRLSLYRLLVQAGTEGLAAGRIAVSLKVSPATLSFHLKELNHAGLIASRQQGRFVIYTANYEAMNALLSFLTAHCCLGAVEQCLTVSELPTMRCRTLEQPIPSLLPIRKRKASKAS